MRKPKLTDEELSAKLAAAKERSQNVAAAHARAQADAANFEERERIAQQKREKDRVERRAMDNEREKNRQRKMAVMGGREWDAGKNEDDFKTQNGRTAARKMQTQDEISAEEGDLRMYEWHDDRGRGRGGFGRGGPGFDDIGAGGQQQKPNWESDFPALPGAAQKSAADEDTPKPTPRRWDSGDGGGGSWAEQVESSEALQNTGKPRNLL